jgi:hypothetical protein
MRPPHLPVSSMEMKVDVDDHLHGYRVSLVHRRPELILANRLDGLLIQSQAEVMDNADVLGIAG